MSLSSQFSEIAELHATRRADSLASTYRHDLPSLSAANTLILHSASDWGVCRNGGRRGSHYAPEAITTVLGKMAAHQLSAQLIAHSSVSDLNAEKENFVEAQQREVRTLANTIGEFNGQCIIHLGGGHDHIYPLMASLYSPGKKIKVLNIDAHMDTRTDHLPHSGTPFRQFSELAKDDFELVQLGIHSFANSPSTTTPLAHSKMHCISFSQLEKESWGFTRPIDELLQYHFSPQSAQSNGNKEVWILSLDCDALEAGIMEGVSAVNHQGIPLHTIAEIFKYFKQHAPRLIAGLYEYNPIFDNLSQKGARALASLIYSVL